MTVTGIRSGAPRKQTENKSAPEGSIDPELLRLAEEEGGGGDPLMACLVFLTRVYQRPYSAAVLRAGLPIPSGVNLSPSLFVRGAARAGLVARVVRRPLKKLTAMDLPVVAILVDDQACVIVERSKKSFTVMLPETGGGVQDVSRAALAKRFAGYVIYARPDYHFEPGRETRGVREPRAWFWGEMARNARLYAQVAVGAALVNTFALASPLFVMTVYDRVVPNNALDTLWVLAVGVIVILGFDFVVRTLRGYFIDVAGRRADVALASRIFDHVLNVQMAARPASSGAFANTLREFESVRDFFTSASIATLVDLPFLALFIAVIWIIGGPLAWVPMVAVPVVLAFGVAVQFPLGHVVRRGAEQADARHGVLFETIGGLETIKSVGADSRMRYLWEKSVAQSARTVARARMLSMFTLNLTSLVQQVGAVAIVVFGVLLIGAGQLSVGALLACVLLNGRAIGSLAQVAQLLVRGHQARTALHALDKVMQLPVERPRDRSFLHRPQLKGGIKFRNVTFTYPGRSTPAVTDASFTVEPGERVGIIGRVGSGKSTVQKLILGLYYPQEGGVLLDGTEVRQIDPAELRRAVGAVPQDIFLFRGTVRENLVVGAPHASDDQILAAARISGVDDFLSSHPSGYDLEVGERGEGLSGGQRQQIAFARALILEPEVLLLDEPTNAMDSVAENQLRERLTEVLPGRTLLLVTHRSSLLPLVDRLIVVDQGQIAADGPREQVIQALSGGRVQMMGE